VERTGSGSLATAGIVSSSVDTSGYDTGLVSSSVDPTGSDTRVVRSTFILRVLPEL
jgi:hypothetical protein